MLDFIKCNSLFLPIFYQSASVYGVYDVPVCSEDQVKVEVDSSDTEQAANENAASVMRRYSSYLTLNRDVLSQTLRETNKTKPSL